MLKIKGWKKKILNFLSKDRGKTIIFINVRDHLDKFALLLDEVVKKVKNEVLIICFNSAIPVYFRRLNVNLKLSEEYLSGEDYEYIDKYTTNLTRRWYLVKGKDGRGITEYGDIQLGSLTEFNFRTFLIHRIKNLEVIKKVIRLEKPNEIITMEDTGELDCVARIISQADNLAHLSLTQRPLLNSWKIVKTKIRAKLSDLLYLSLIDSLMRMLLLKTRLDNLILIDPRAHEMLVGPVQLKNFIFCPTEKGLANRLYALKKKKMYISFGTPLGSRLKEQFYEQKNKLLAKWHVLSNDLSFTNRFVYKDIAIWDLVEGKLCQMFTQRFPRALRLIIQVKEFHRHKKIEAVVLRADGRETEKTIIMIAEKLNIPTLYVTHGVLTQSDGHDILFCTKTAIWGQADFARYVSLGNSPDKLVITGSPKYDEIYTRSQSISKEFIYTKLQLDNKKDFIILATQPIVKFSAYNTDDRNEILLRNVLSAVSGIADIQLVVKLHPFEDYTMYKRVLKETNSKDVVLVKDIDILSLINASVCLLTFSSTVALEAMILEKPVIIINLGKKKYGRLFAEKGAALEVYQPEDIRPAIDRILEDQELNKLLESGRKKTVSYYIDKLDGNSSQRVVDLVNKMSGNAQFG